MKRLVGSTVAVAALAGCSLALSLDGFADPMASTDGGASTSGSTAGTSGSPDGSPDFEAGASSGIVAPLPVGAAPLTRSGTPAGPSLTFAVEGRVSFTFTAQRSWQLVGWTNAGAVDLGDSSATSMSEPIQVGYDNSSYGTQLSKEGKVEILEETAARATIRSTFVHRPSNGSVHTATTTYAIYADGRIVEAISYRLTSGTVPAMDFFEFGHTNVTRDTTWDISTLAGGAGFEFLKKGGRAALVAATHRPERGISNDDVATNRFWTYEGNYTGAFDASWEYRFYGDSDRVQREGFVRSVGAAIARPEYDRPSGAWKLDAKGASSVSFQLPADTAWEGPAFAIDGWNAASVRADLGGKAANVIAARSGGRLLILYIGSIAATASALDRTFVFSAP